MNKSMPGLQMKYNDDFEVFLLVSVSANNRGMSNVLLYSFSCHSLKSSANSSIYFRGS